MPSAEDVVIINEGLESRTRSTSSGMRTRYTISVASEPIVHNFAEDNLGQPVATAIRDAISRGIKAITQSASEATLRYRAEARKSFAAGAKWAVKRYSGGSTGSLEPGASTELFNDSGRLSNLTVRQSRVEKKWVIYSPTNRMNGAGFKDQAAFVAMANRLRELVPAMRNPFTDATVLSELERVVGEVLIRKLRRSTQSGDQALASIVNSVSEIAQTAQQDLDAAG